MKFYDKSGNTHETMMDAAISDIRSRATNVIGIFSNKETSHKPSVLNSMPFGKCIRIDREKNKLYLIDNSDNIIMENDIDPNLVVRTNNDFIDLKSIDPRLLEPEFIDQALNGDKVKNAIDRSIGIK